MTLRDGDMPGTASRPSGRAPHPPLPIALDADVPAWRSALRRLGRE